MARSDHGGAGVERRTGSARLRAWAATIAAVTCACFGEHARASAAPVRQAATPSAPAPRHSLVLFVADGLRDGAVDERSAPAMSALAREGVRLRDSHSLFPTFTTANASALATGHLLGDTGDYSNAIYVGPVPSLGSRVPFLEYDPVLGDIDKREGWDGNFLHEDTLLELARRAGMATASIGKLGPALIFDHRERSGGATIVVDDSTGHDDGKLDVGIPLAGAVAARFAAAGLALVAPDRGPNGKRGDANNPGATAANGTQQDYFAAVATRVVLPLFAEHKDRPFLLVFWSRDPDGSQHNQGDSFQALAPGINGPTSHAAIRNCDDDLARIRAALEELGLAATTDVVVTADHGFSTISKASATSPSAGYRYADVRERQLPPGFLALDLARALALECFDPDAGDTLVLDPALDANRAYVDRIHPKFGNGLLGADPKNPSVVVAANGGSDLVYVLGPSLDERKKTTQRVLAALLAQDYVGGLFVDDELGEFPGALRMSDVGLFGSAVTPRPSVVVGFRSFDGGGGSDPVRDAAEVADTILQQGQGMHGSFGRADTWIFGALFGPDFRAGWADDLPASNADIGRTIAAVLGLVPHDNGELVGRVLTETFPGGAVPSVRDDPVSSRETPEHLHTVANRRAVGDVRYVDAAGFSGRTVGLTDVPPKP